MINNYRDAYKDSFNGQEKADLYFRLATFFLKQGQSKLAIDAAETSLSFNPNFLWSIDLLEQSYRIFEKNILKAKVYKKRFCSIVGKDNCAKLESEE